MDVQVGDVDIHELRVPGSKLLDASAVVLMIAMAVYIVATVYSLYRETRATREPLLHGQMEL